VSLVSFTRLTFISGLLTYVVINSLTYLTRLISFGRIIPADEDHREYWTWMPAGTLPWFIRVCQDPHSVFQHNQGPEIREITSTKSSFERQRYAPSNHEKDIEAVGQREIRITIPRGSLDKGSSSRF
jgi:AGZA family xanthine/uracil permease-like MFS transporter